MSVSDKWCNCVPCTPCEKCDDDAEAIRVDILDSKQCDTDCCWCWKGCKDNCWINIQSSNPDCLAVTTEECGVVTLHPTCPPIVVAWDNVTVEVEDCDWTESLAPCSRKFIVNANCEDTKVKACSWDTTPSTLDNKLEAWSWIFIDPIGCDWDNAKLRISFDDSVIPPCPSIPSITIDDQSKLIDATASWHHIVIRDREPAAYYAKLVLSEWHDWIQSSIATNSTPYFALFNGWASWSTVYNRNMVIESWKIKITRSWLYAVGFSWSAECGSWVHAFRVQMYSTQAEGSDRWTIIESRYSAPIGDQPFEISWNPSSISQGPFVTDVTVKSDDTVKQVYKSWTFNFKVDNPLWWPATDIEWTQREAQGKSASLWSYVSRMPVAWTTIVELKVWDYICLWVKVSTEVRYTWDIMWKVDDKVWHFALLCKNSSRSWWKNTWPECWLSFYASLMHPLPETNFN